MIGVYNIHIDTRYDTVLQYSHGWCITRIAAQVEKKETII
jgi:hypothetical protein